MRSDVPDVPAMCPQRTLCFTGCGHIGHIGHIVFLKVKKEKKKEKKKKKRNEKSMCPMCPMCPHCLRAAKQRRNPFPPLTAEGDRASVDHGCPP